MSNILISPQGKQGILKKSVEEKVNHKHACICYKEDIEVLEKRYPTKKYSSKKDQDQDLYETNNDSVITAKKLPRYANNNLRSH